MKKMLEKKLKVLIEIKLEMVYPNFRFPPSCSYALIWYNTEKEQWKSKWLKKRRLCSHEFVKNIYAVGNDNFLSDGSNQIKKMP